MLKKYNKIILIELKSLNNWSKNFQNISIIHLKLWSFKKVIKFNRYIALINAMEKANEPC